MTEAAGAPIDTETFKKIVRSGDFSLAADHSAPSSWWCPAYIATKARHLELLSVAIARCFRRTACGSIRWVGNRLAEGSREECGSILTFFTGTYDSEHAFDIHIRYTARLRRYFCGRRGLSGITS